MFFFNKKKKYEAINAQSKKDILAQIEGYIQRTRDIAVAAKLNSAKNLLISQGMTSSERVPEIDRKIIALLADLGKDFASGSMAVVEKKLDGVLEKLNERAPLCADNSAFRTKQEIKQDKEAEKARKQLGMKASSVIAEELYSPEELVEFMLLEAADRQKKMAEEKQTLFHALSTNPNDPVANYRWTTLKVKMKEISDSIAMLHSEGNRTVLINSVQRLTLEQKRMIATRQISDEQFDVIMSDYRKMVDARNADNVRTDEAMKTFYASDMSGAKATVSAQNARPSIFSDPEFIAMGAGSAQTTQPSIFSDPEFIAMGGGGVQPAHRAGVGNAATDAVFENIDEIVRSLEKCELMYSDRLDDVSADLKDMDMRLKQLLKKRETATASECLVLDGEIDRLNAERVNAKNAVKRYRQALAVNTEKLSLARSLSTQRDLNEVNRRMQESTGGAFTSFEDYAMALRDYVEKSNSELESIGTVNVVASGAEINMDTMTGREADSTGDFEIKDEDKYKALEMELGIRKA